MEPLISIQVVAANLHTLPTHKLQATPCKLLSADMRHWGNGPSWDRGDTMALSAPFLAGLTSLSLKGPSEAVHLLMSHLDLSSVKSLIFDTTPNEEILRLVRSMPSLVTVKFKSAMIGTPVYYGLLESFETLGTFGNRVESLTAGVRLWKGVLRMQHLKHLHLTFDLRSVECAWDDCFSNLPALTHCRLSRRASHTVVQATFNMIVRRLATLVPGLQCLEVDSQIMGNSVDLETDSLHMLANLTHLHTLEVRSLPQADGVVLSALTCLVCENWTTGNLGTTPNITTLRTRSMPGNALPARILSFETTDSQLSRTTSENNFQNVQHLTINRGLSVFEVTADDQLFYNQPSLSPLDVSVFVSVRSITIHCIGYVQMRGAVLGRYLLGLMSAPSCLRSVRLRNCQISETTPHLQVMCRIEHIKHITMFSCTVTLSLVQLLSDMPNLQGIDLLDCIGVSQEECRMVQLSHTGLLAFRLRCRPSEQLP